MQDLGKIFKKHGFEGPITVEYEGNKNDLENCSIARQVMQKEV
jgi:hypothetical protein